jgi:hypothetical protein
VNLWNWTSGMQWRKCKYTFSHFIEISSTSGARWYFRLFRSLLQSSAQKAWDLIFMYIYIDIFVYLLLLSHSTCFKRCENILATNFMPSLNKVLIRWHMWSRKNICQKNFFHPYSCGVDYIVFFLFSFSLSLSLRSLHDNIIIFSFLHIFPFFLYVSNKRMKLK